MNEYVQSLIADAPNNNYARNLVREYLQSRILEALQQQGAFSSWAFLGGTALRFLYSMPRFSEDLDFSLKQPGMQSAFGRIIQGIIAMFSAEGYTVMAKSKDHRIVQSAFIVFTGLLNNLGLSPHSDETVAIKVEVDTQPPQGAEFGTTILRKHVLLNLLHYDKASLLAGKLHALLSRPYVKGRDVYDLIWYLADPSWPEPNIIFLQHALQQTDWKGPEMDSENWRKILTEHIAGFDFKKIRRDVEPFIERVQDLDLLNLAVLKSLLV
jgi:predicted nucleotidyltransferase component of viral defense system